MTNLRDRAVLITYIRGSRRRRASGLLVRDGLVITANHCTSGDADTYQVWAHGAPYPARVVWQSNSSHVDLALIEAATLTVEPMRLARLHTGSDARIDDVECICFPSWMRPDAHSDTGPLGGDRRAQLFGSLPLGARGAARGDDPAAQLPVFTIDGRSTTPSVEGLSPLEIADRWRGASGGGLQLQDGGIKYCVGIVSAKEVKEAPNSLRVVSFDLVDNIEDPDHSRKFWRLLGVREDAIHILPNDRRTITTKRLAHLREWRNDIARETFLELEKLIMLQELGIPRPNLEDK